jgi:hypothetical protein
MGLVPFFLEGLARHANKPEDRAILQAMKAIYGGLGAMSFILSVMSGLLLAVGIGQLRYREWARRWSVYWSIAALVSLGVMVGIQMGVIGPGYRSMFDAMANLPGKHGGPPVDLSALSWLFGGAFAFSSVLFYAPYPILMLIFFSRDRVRAAMLT